jgi:hypothetical protein
MFDSPFFSCDHAIAPILSFRTGLVHIRPAADHASSRSAPQTAPDGFCGAHGPAPFFFHLPCR